MDSFAQRLAARFKSKKKLESGNTVYVYSPRQVALRNSEKAVRLEKLRGKIGELRTQVRKDLSSDDPDTALAALAVALIDHTYERIGNDGSAEERGHYGVTGWQKSHISFGKGRATIRYIGKSGVKQKKTVTDAKILAALKDAYEGCEGDEIFTHSLGKVGASKVNAYLKKFDVTAKDLRGFHANLEMQKALRDIRSSAGALPEDPKAREEQLKKEFKQALKRTSEAVGHEAATLRNQYLVPKLEEMYLKDGTILGKMKAASIVAFRYKQASLKTLDQAWVKKMRGDFLILMKNLPRVSNYVDAKKLREAFTYYSKTFKEFLFDELLNPRRKEGLHDLEALRKEGWDFYLELTSYPLFGTPVKELSEEQIFARYNDKKADWEKRIKARAQKFWKRVRDTLNVRTSPISVTTPDTDRQVIEGFQVLIKGFTGTSQDDWQIDALSKFREALKLYRRNASRVPWMLKHQLPLELNFLEELSRGGNYDGQVIRVFALSSTGESYKWLTHVIAHEMGHHLHKSLDASAQEFWSTAIRQDYGPLDIAPLLRVWPTSTKYSHSFVRDMSDTDPVLALQVDVLSGGFEGDSKWESREDFQDALDSGQTTVSVPKHPITGYAGKSPEEAFCEALGLLVAYGPAAVLEQVRHWLTLTIPGEVRLAHIPG